MPKQGLSDWVGPDKASLCPFLEISLAAHLAHIPTRGSEEKNGLAVFPEGMLAGTGLCMVAQGREASQEVIPGDAPHHR